MAKRVQWEANFSLGQATLDAQHRAILEQCNALADRLDAADEPGFDACFKELMVLAGDHFAAEDEALALRAYADIEDFRAECEEFDYLADEIITTENFDRDELQTFLGLWWSGHIAGAARRLRAVFAAPPDGLAAPPG